MATLSDALEKLPSRLGHKRITVEGYCRDLRAGGLLPIGRRGGGRFAAQLDDEDLKNILLGLAGHQPSEAAAAVRALDL